MKIHKLLYLGSGGTPSKAYAAISIPAGKRKVVKLPTFSEGQVARVVVKQATGTPVAYAIELVDSIVPYGDEDSNANYNAAVAVEPAFFRIISKQTAIAGDALDYRDNPEANLMASYINGDQVGSSSNVRAIYLVLIPTNAAGITTWNVAITIHGDHY